jgi:bifunctional enzyme CysN/CysC
MISNREQMNLVIVGHVDHGKSTVIGRLLADTNSLPEGKLEEVKERCARNAKPFEYAFLLDALKDEQSQGITIDSARCFFRSYKREYILIDAPGHIEFLKNMISGAARAEAAVLVIDAYEGIRENSRRHGYLLGMLGVRQVVVAINKMDLVDGSKDVFATIQKEYASFLSKIGVDAKLFIPISARNGDMVAERGIGMPWYTGPTLLEALDAFEKEPPALDQPLRLPVQDIYKFTEAGDDRRIVAGRIETGRLKTGDEITFYPSQKKTRVASLEAFNAPQPANAHAGHCVGVTLTEQIFVQPGEIMVRNDEPSPQTARSFKVNLLWLKKEPMVLNKRYLLKLSTARVPVWLRQVNVILDASDLSTDNCRQHIERHDVAECVLETLKPAAFDLATEIRQTSRFVVIDNFQIAGGGIILESLDPDTDLIDEYVLRRQKDWRRSRITPDKRYRRMGQRPSLVIITGADEVRQTAIAQRLEEKLFEAGRHMFYLGVNNSLPGGSQGSENGGLRDETIRRLGETAHLFTDAGLILITSITDLEHYELNMIKTLNQPGDTLVVGAESRTLGADQIDLQLAQETGDDQAASEIAAFLTQQNYLPEYYL